MSSYYSNYKSNNKPTLQTNSKEEVIRRYKEALERKQYLTTTTSNNNKNHYKNALLLICGGLIVGFGVLIYSVGYKLGKSKCKYKKYSS